MKLVFIADAHANLPALEAVVRLIQKEGYDLLFHLGDAIAIGPHPREALELLLSLKDVRFVIGNHDDWYVNGLPQPRPAWMSEGEVEHQLWTHAQLGDDFKPMLSKWPRKITHEIDEIKLACLHYALTEDGNDFKPILRDPLPSDLDDHFDLNADLVLFGHTHLEGDLQGRSRYITPDSLGCQKFSVAPYTLIEIKNGEIAVQYRRVPYESDSLFDEFENRGVPEREFIYKVFFGGRFPPYLRK